MRQPLQADPLDWADKWLEAFSASIHSRFVKNYHDDISRTLFWRQGTLVKFIQLKRNETQTLYELWLGAYRLPLPLLNFWTIYLDSPNDFSKKIAGFSQPSNREALDDWLFKSKQQLDSLKIQSVPKGITYRTIKKNFFIPENIITFLLIVVAILLFFRLFSE